MYIMLLKNAICSSTLVLTLNVLHMTFHKYNAKILALLMFLIEIDDVHSFPMNNTMNYFLGYQFVHFKLIL